MEIIKINKNNDIKKYSKIILIVAASYIFFFFENINNKNFVKFKTNVSYLNFSSNIYFQSILPKIRPENKYNNVVSSLNEIFNSRKLYISDMNLTEEYIRYIRPINETEDKKYKKKYSEKEIKISPNYFKKRKDQYNFKEFVKLCVEEKLIDTKKIEYNSQPLISVILPSFNKEKIIMRSIRSIQNQKFKNIEIIIVDDCSTDKSFKHYKYLLKNDPRVRIFIHLKNMGLWRSRLDGFLYSRGKYILYFDTGDFYEDNYVLEDAYNLMEKYNLDSAKLIFRLIFSYYKLKNSKIPIHVNGYSKIVYESQNIINTNKKVFQGWGNIWTRITRANICTKGLYLLNKRILNIYKNFWEDIWHNTIINKVSYSFLIVKRVGYLYYKDGNGFGDIKLNTEKQKDKIIQEFINFLIFDYYFLPKKDNKTEIIKKLHKYNSTKSLIKLNYFKSNFYILNDLLNLLIKDPFVSASDKRYLNKLLNESKTRENLRKYKKFGLL